MWASRFLRRLTFDMRGGRKQAKLACGRPLDGRVRPLWPKRTDSRRSRDRRQRFANAHDAQCAGGDRPFVAIQRLRSSPEFARGWRLQILRPHSTSVDELCVSERDAGRLPSHKKTAQAMNSRHEAKNKPPQKWKFRWARSPVNRLAACRTPPRQYSAAGMLRERIAQRVRRFILRMGTGGLTFDMRGGRKQAKPDCGRPLDGRVRALGGHDMNSQKHQQETYRHAEPENHLEP